MLQLRYLCSRLATPYTDSFTTTQNWQQIEQILKQEGCSSPVRYLVCFNPAHPNRWSLSKENDACNLCEEKGTVPFYYLSIHDKISKWCSSEITCEKILSHWMDRDAWMHGEASELSELWHSSRFQELSWLWNPNSRLVVSVKIIVYCVS